jgi:DNA primase small subunit
MTDYDSVRTCCSSAAICRLCWTFIAAAVRVLHEALTEQFGFKHLLWVYSGRRGIHLWISDKEAMELNDEGRKAIVGWLEVVKGGKDMAKKVNVRLGAGKNSPGSLPPSLQMALNPLATLFSSLILTDQNCFGSEDGYEALLQLIPDRSVVDNLRKKWEADPDRHSADKWGDLKSEVKRFDKGSSTRVSPFRSLIISAPV